MSATSIIYTYSRPLLSIIVTRERVHFVKQAAVPVKAQQRSQSINQSSFNNGMTERKPTITQNTVHRIKSRNICLIYFFIEHPYNEVRV